MTTLLNVGVAAFTATAIALTVLGLLSWRRSRRTKFSVVTLGFGWFALAGVLSTWWLFSREDLGSLFTIHVLLSSIGLLTIYVAIVKR